MVTLLPIDEDQAIRQRLDMLFRETHEGQAAGGAVIYQGKMTEAAVTMTEAVTFTVPNSGNFRLDHTRFVSPASCRPNMSGSITSQSPQVFVMQQLILQKAGAAAPLREQSWNGACPWITHHWTANQSSWELNGSVVGIAKMNPARQTTSHFNSNSGREN